MRTEVIKYTDYNGVERTETFLFNFTKAEVHEMELGRAGGLSQKLTSIIEANDAPEIIKVFKEIILKAYGEKSEDGRRFIKSKELSEAFSQTEAYSELYIKLSTDADAATTFMKEVLPPDFGLAGDNEKA